MTTCNCGHPETEHPTPEGCSHRDGKRYCPCEKFRPVELPPGYEPRGVGFVRRRVERAEFVELVLPHADGTWEARATAWHLSERVRAQSEVATVADLAGALRFAEEQARVLEAWVGR